MSKDMIGASICLLVFLVTNLWGIYLWRIRDRMTAYSGIQRFLAGASLSVALVVILLRARGSFEAANSAILTSTRFPAWLVLIGPALMLFIYIRERSVQNRD